MLGKLIKHEFAATGRLLLPAYGAILILSGILRFTGSLPSNTPKVLITLLFIMSIFGTFLLTFALLLQRFYKNLLGNEGYLMMTLPVGVDSLIWSKIIVSMVWIIASCFVTLLSALVIVLPLREFPSFFSECIHTLGIITPMGIPVFVFAIEIGVLFFAGFLSSILQIYASMAVGQLVDRHRALLSLGAFLAFSTIFQLLCFTLFSLISYIPFLQNIEKFFTSYILDTPIISHFVLLFATVISLITSAIYYFITRYLLKNKLNLA